MPVDVNAPARAPFLQTPEALIDAPGLSDSALRLLQAMAKLPPRNGRNSDAVARALRMGKDKTNAARKSLRAHGHWHARKRQNVRGEIRDQRLASLTPLLSPDEIAAGWAAAEEAVRLGKDTAASRRLGVRILNSTEWAAPKPAAGSPAPRTTRRRPPEGDQTEKKHQTPLPVPASVPASVPARAPQPDPGLPPLDGPLAPYADRAERVLLRLRRTAPRLALAVPDARELAQIAGHYLLRGEGTETLHSVLTQGLPAEGVRAPKGFVRTRLLRYLPPLPDWESPATAPAPAPASPPARPPEAAARPVRPEGPVDLIRRGEGWRAALRAADAAPGGPRSARPAAVSAASAPSAATTGAGGTPLPD